MSSPVSKPKIHRLPARMPKDRHPVLTAVLSYGDTAKFIFMMSSLAFITVLSGLLISRFIPAELLHKDIMAQGAATFPSPISDAAAAETMHRAPGKIIVLKEKGDMIIGQMAKISPVDMSASAQIDTDKGQALLSIVNRH